MNKQTFLALPALADASPTTIAILVSGTAAHQLHPLGWLQQANITHWGNFDAAGPACHPRCRKAARQRPPLHRKPVVLSRSGSCLCMRGQQLERAL
ncbi:Wadjet anti-phage system protein JetD domain-containing protein [Corynebacterium guaraldiae]|uniref:Wadjet anti-phage system protein JetD domain-containing protein n=1 Tax=Corynebacterium guaraldiae TaxID=3051103 RepID=UPI001E2BC180|nr:Wadjet anti-phage system protein JetD domain-containing protein [Corynebacterium guaraldiae]MDK6808440.1 DUF2220 family protein [Corynebacterium aurimucosum]